jgi:hypothetical protein
MLRVNNLLDEKGFLTLNGVGDQNVGFVVAGHRFDEYLLELEKG